MRRVDEAFQCSSTELRQQKNLRMLSSAWIHRHLHLWETELGLFENLFLKNFWRLGTCVKSYNRSKNYCAHPAMYIALMSHILLHNRSNSKCFCICKQWAGSQDVLHATKLIRTKHGVRAHVLFSHARTNTRVSTNSFDMGLTSELVSAECFLFVPKLVNFVTTTSVQWAYMTYAL